MNSDWEGLERRGHKSARYADDCNVYVKSKRAGERVMQYLVKIFAKLGLRINAEKSAVARAWVRKFLGYSFWVAPGQLIKRRVAPKALEAMKERVRQITSRNGGRSIAQSSRSYAAIWWGGRRTSGSPICPAYLRTWMNGCGAD
jgi:RNA-directed DNA polymerase